MRYFIAVDVIRYDERLLINALRDLGVNVELIKVDSEVLPLNTSNAFQDSVILIRPLSAYNAIYSAIAFESMGGIAINSSKALYICNDKVLTYSYLIREGIRIPKTYLALSSTAIQNNLNHLKYPLIDKPPIGSWGRLVSYVRDGLDMKLVMEHRDQLNSPILRAHILQEVIGFGRDIRCIVVGDEVLGCMVRKSSNAEEWRSNIALGGTAENYIPSDEVRELAIRSAKSVGAEIAGVDLLPGEYFYVNEVNGVPEFKGFISATGIKVHEYIAKYLISISRK